MDSIHADDFCIRHHRQLTRRGSAEASQTWHHSRVVRRQHDEHTLATLHSIHGRSGCSLVAGHDEIDAGALHRVSQKLNRSHFCRGLFHDTDRETQMIERSG
jgi:hypothetical protein